ncbi:MAG: PEP-CTERM sorting domain-containing protein [Armatimonadetes bacterium]|nr:PEP-CTERM sorting domain-containing protein [Akkermansiaceae bacterium]
MKNIAIISSFSLACTLPAAAASLFFVETFSVDDDEQGWFPVSVASGEMLQQNTATDMLDFSGTAYSSFYVAADGLSSAGAFTGDYPAAGVTGFTFDLFLASTSTVDGFYFELANFTEDETWQYTIPVPSFDTTNNFFIPFDNGLGWSQISGDQPFSFILGQTESIGIAFTSASSGDIAGSIDNIGTVPEPSALAIFALTGLLATTRRRKKA